MIFLQTAIVIAQLVPIGLQGKYVRCIRQFDGHLYAGTYNDGVYLNSSGDSSWINLGLQGNIINCVYPHRDDGTGHTLIAGVNRAPGPDSTVIFAYDGNSWTSADSGVIHSLTYGISSIEGISTGVTSQIVFASGSTSRIYRRTENTWEGSFVGGAYYAISVSQLNKVWGGGETGFFAPIIRRSSDQGLNWNPSWVDTFAQVTDGAVSSIAIDPTNSSIVLATGWSGFVVKTTDDGASWALTGIPIWSRKLTIDYLNPTHYFCGGSLGSSGPGRILESTDGGQSWIPIALPDSFPTITDMALESKDSLDLNVATRDGVYRLRLFSPAFGISVNTGWNMVSIPKHVSDYKKSSLFPGSLSSAFSYQGNYQIRDTLENGRGYWLKFSATEILRIASDLNIDTDTIDVNPGWNIIGSISKPVLTSTITSSPPGITTSPFFHYQGVYTTSDSIKPGLGYWVKANQIGKLFLSASGTDASPLNRIIMKATGENPPPSPGTDAPNPAPHIPDRFALYQNYPNPFNPITRFDYALVNASHVTLEIYNLLGEVVATLVDEAKGPGEYSATWDAGSYSSGIYFYKLEAGSYSDVKKLVLLR